VSDDGTVRRDTVSAGRWTARGVVKVTGDAAVVDGSLDGSVTVGGKLTGSTVRYHGTLDVEGAVEVRERFGGSGSFRAGATLHAGEADLQGSVRVTGATTVDRSLTVRGSLSTTSIRAAAVDVEGEVHVSGPTEAGSVSTHLADDSEFGVVRASTVRLRAKVPNLVEKVLGRRLAVHVERVEADTVELEAVDVDFVRSPQITLGRNAHVTEYEGTIVRQHPSSRVGFESKSPPPYGLTR
jgi:cytoskeletal protein CcmA (bactofilin family)